MYIPPPLLPAVLPATVQFAIRGEERSQVIPCKLATVRVTRANHLAAGQVIAPHATGCTIVGAAVPLVTLAETGHIAVTDAT